MRVTETMRLTDATGWITTPQRRLDELSAQAATGKKVVRPSDEPAAYASIVRRSDRIARLESRKDAIGAAQGRLELSEGALAASADIMLRVREITIQMADGIYGATDRASAAEEVALLREELLAQANAKGADGGYLFAGTATDQPAFDTTGAFVGNDAALRVEYADGRYMDANASGQSAFADPAGRDIFADLDALVTALNANDQIGVQASLDAIDEGQRQLVAARGDAGVRLGRLESAIGVTDNALVLGLSQLSDKQDADLAEVAIDLANTQNAYQRALAVTQQMLQLTRSLEPF
jgi:flagellar hook-associated protein 3 FlgL